MQMFAKPFKKCTAKYFDKPHTKFEYLLTAKLIECGGFFVCV